MEKRKSDIVQLFFVIPPVIICADASHLPVLINTGINTILIAALMGMAGGLIGTGVYHAVKEKRIAFKISAAIILNVAIFGVFILLVKLK